MTQEDGFSNLHFLVAAVFAVTVALGSFAGTMAMTSMNEGEMSEVTGQEGINMDLHLKSSLTFSVLWQDQDGATNAGNTTGIVGLHGITPTGSLDITGLTIDADGSTQVGSSTGGAIVIGIPSVPSGIAITDIDPGGAGSSDFGASSTNSIGSVKVGGISGTDGSRVEIAAN